MRTLEETHRTERAKWDAIAAREARDTTLPGDGDFAAYAARSNRLHGVGEFLGDLRGKRVLEYGCGLGRITARLARAGAEVSAFDISPRSVAVTRERLRADGVEADVAVAAGEALPYPSESFDAVVGTAILHHLDRVRARSELLRVMRPGARAAFVEPLGTNALLAFARDWIPYRQKTPRGPDNPLTYDDLAYWGEPFTEFHFRETELLAMAQRVFGYGERFAALHRLDRALLDRAPFLRRYCRRVVIYAVK